MSREAGRGWPKYECPPDMLTVEEGLNTMQLSSTQVEEQMMETIDQQLASAKTQEERQAWANIKVGRYTERLASKIKEAFVEDFVLWVAGRSPYNVVSREETTVDAYGNETKKQVRYTPWGNKSMAFLPGADKLLGSPILNRDKVIKTLTKLIATNPRNVDELWIYYKYIVRKVGIDTSKNSVKEQHFYNDYDYFEKNPMMLEKRQVVDADGNPTGETEQILVEDPAYRPMDVNNPGVARFDAEKYDVLRTKTYEMARDGTIDLLETDEFAGLSPEDKVYALQISKRSAKRQLALDAKDRVIADNVQQLIDTMVPDLPQEEFDDVYLDAQEEIMKIQDKRRKAIVIRKVEQARQAYMNKGKVPIEEVDDPDKEEKRRKKRERREKEEQEEEEREERRRRRRIEAEEEEEARLKRRLQELEEADERVRRRRIEEEEEREKNRPPEKEEEEEEEDDIDKELKEVEELVRGPDVVAAEQAVKEALKSSKIALAEIMRRANEMRDTARRGAHTENSLQEIYHELKNQLAELNYANEGAFVSAERDILRMSTRARNHPRAEDILEHRAENYDKHKEQLDENSRKLLEARQYIAQAFKDAKEAPGKNLFDPDADDFEMDMGGDVGAGAADPGYAPPEEEPVPPEEEEEKEEEEEEPIEVDNTTRMKISKALNKYEEDVSTGKISKEEKLKTLDDIEEIVTSALDANKQWIEAKRRIYATRLRKAENDQAAQDVAAELEDAEETYQATANALKSKLVPINEAKQKASIAVPPRRVAPVPVPDAAAAVPPKRVAPEPVPAAAVPPKRVAPEPVPAAAAPPKRVAPQPVPAAAAPPPKAQPTPTSSTTGEADTSIQAMRNLAANIENARKEMIEADSAGTKDMTAKERTAFRLQTKTRLKQYIDNTREDVSREANRFHQHLEDRRGELDQLEASNLDVPEQLEEIDLERQRLDEEEREFDSAASRADPSYQRPERTERGGLKSVKRRPPMPFLEREGEDPWKALKRKYSYVKANNTGSEKDIGEEHALANRLMQTVTERTKKVNEEVKEMQALLKKRGISEEEKQRIKDNIQAKNIEYQEFIDEADAIDSMATLSALDETLIAEEEHEGEKAYDEMDIDDDDEPKKKKATATKAKAVPPKVQPGAAPSAAPPPTAPPGFTPSAKDTNAKVPPKVQPGFNPFGKDASAAPPPTAPPGFTPSAKDTNAKVPPKVQPGINPFGKDANAKPSTAPPPPGFTPSAKDTNAKVPPKVQPGINPFGKPPPQQPGAAPSAAPPPKAPPGFNPFGKPPPQQQQKQPSGFNPFGKTPQQQPGAAPSAAPPQQQQHQQPAAGRKDWHNLKTQEYQREEAKPKTTDSELDATAKDIYNRELDRANFEDLESLPQKIGASGASEPVKRELTQRTKRIVEKAKMYSDDVWHNVTKGAKVTSMQGVVQWLTTISEHVVPKLKQLNSDAAAGSYAELNKYVDDIMDGQEYQNKIGIKNYTPDGREVYTPAYDTKKGFKSLNVRTRDDLEAAIAGFDRLQSMIVGEMNNMNKKELGAKDESDSARFMIDLGAKYGDSFEEINKLYKKASLRLHPDRQRGKTPQEIAATNEKMARLVAGMSAFKRWRDAGGYKF